MAIKIKIKNSNVANKAPTLTDLDVAELAINLKDKKIYTKEPDGPSIIELGGGSLVQVGNTYVGTPKNGDLWLQIIPPPHQPNKGIVDLSKPMPFNVADLKIGDYATTNSTTIKASGSGWVGFYGGPGSWQQAPVTPNKPIHWNGAKWIKNMPSPVPPDPGPPSPASFKIFKDGAWSPVGGDSGNIIATDTTLSVDDVNGNDKTGDGTTTNPFATFPAALQFLENSKVTDGAIVTVSGAAGSGVDGQTFKYNGGVLVDPKQLADIGSALNKYLKKEGMVVFYDGTLYVSTGTQATDDWITCCAGKPNFTPHDCTIPKKFKFSVDTYATQFQLYIETNDGTDWTIDWGDGTNPDKFPSHFESGAQTNCPSHNYALNYKGDVTIGIGGCSSIKRINLIKGPWAVTTKQIPDGVTEFFAKQQSTTKFSGDIDDLPTSLIKFHMNAKNTLSGNINNLPKSLTSLEIGMGNTVSGDIKNLPPKLKECNITGNNTLSGNIGTYPSSCDYFTVDGHNTISGNIEDIKLNIPNSSTVRQSLKINGQNTISGDISKLTTKFHSINIDNDISNGKNTIGGDMGTWTTADSELNINIKGQNVITGDIEHFQPDIDSIHIEGNNSISGDIGKIACKYLRNFVLKSPNINITGDIKNIPPPEPTRTPNPWSGFMGSYIIDGPNTITGDLATLPPFPGLTSFFITGSNTISGDIAFMNKKLATTIGSHASGSYKYNNLNVFHVEGKNTISGNIRDIYSSEATYGAHEKNKPGVITIRGNNTITGNLDDLISLMSEFIISGENTVTMNSTIGMKYSLGKFEISRSSSHVLPAAMVDKILIAIHKKVVLDATKLRVNNGNTITFGPNTEPRTSASDTAVKALKAKGLIIKTQP